MEEGDQDTDDGWSDDDILESFIKFEDENKPGRDDEDKRAKDCCNQKEKGGTVDTKARELKENAEVRTQYKEEIEKERNNTYPVAFERVTSDEEDEIPLAQLKCTSKREDITSKILKQQKKTLNVKRKLIESDESDSFEKDEEYFPTEKDINSSDSEASENFCHFKNTKKNKRRKTCNSQEQTHSIRDKGWKKTPTCIKRSKLKALKIARKSTNKELNEKVKQKLNMLQRKRKCFSPLKMDIEKAKRQSMKEESVKDTIRRYHIGRIDNLLKSNDLRRISIESDGNCFFAAVLRSANMKDDVCQFRYQICDYLVEHIEMFINFCTARNPDIEYLEEQFLIDVQSLSLRGVWNVGIGDCLPLVVAEMLDATIRIYSSSISSPVIDVKPSSTDGPEKIINLAYIAIRGEEHYEAVDIIEPIPVYTATPINSTTSQYDTTQVPANVSPDDPENDIHDLSPKTTPHKRADYQTPVKKVSSRKKKSKPETWKRNIRKQNRCSGKQYVNSRGKEVIEKSVKDQNCERCRFKCNEKISEEERKEIFKVYYSLESYERQRSFICEMITVQTPARTKGKKSTSNQYHLAINNRRERVCRDFFMKTLDIGRKTIDYTIKQKQHGTFTGIDRRGKKPPKNKTNEETLEFVHQHIQMFPRVESHYARKKTKKRVFATRFKYQTNVEIICGRMQKKWKTACDPSKIQTNIL